jgi:peptidase E
MSAHVVAAGGGGFSMSGMGQPTALDRYLLDLSGRVSPQVCFVPTASADDPAYINRFLVAYGTLGVRAQVLTVWEDARRSVDRLAEADIVVVGGGSTVNLIALWAAHGVDRIMARLAATEGKVLFGISAGACAWHEACITDSFGGMEPWRGGLGLVPGSFCPHYDGEAQRTPAYVAAVSDGSIPGGFAADDGAAVHYVGGVPYAFITERPGASVYRVLHSAEPGSSGILVEPQPMTAI